MNRQLYDYHGFTPRRLKEPRFSRLKLLGGWLVYFALYFLTENLIPESQFHVVQCALDEKIPFCEYFVVVYVAWYGFVAGSLAYTLFYNVEGFRRIQAYILVTQLTAMVCYIVFPSVQHLRPAEFPRTNLLTDILDFIYAFDKPVGVCPSLHVAFSFGITSYALKDPMLHRLWKAAAVLFTLLVCVAVCFVKQHSVLDVFAALPVCLIAEFIVYGLPHRQHLYHTTEEN